MRSQNMLWKSGMLESKLNSKLVIVHIGPHKTGSTAIQNSLAENQNELKQAGILFLHSSKTHEAAMLLAREAFVEAEESLVSIASVISGAEAETVILSQEDFCGDLPGRSPRKAIYPRLTKNLRVIARSLQPHRFNFIFFERNENDWLMSCYHQHLKHRTLFSTIASFRESFGESISWSRMLEKPRETFGAEFITVPYSKVFDAGVRSVLGFAERPALQLSHPPSQKNQSPLPEENRLLERINALSGFKPTAWFAKSLLLKGWQPRKPVNLCAPAGQSSADLASVAFPHLTKRATDIFNRQVVDDILPDIGVNLADYLFDILPRDVELPATSRVDIRDQSKILDYHLRGKSQLAKLNALSISYLRRDTSHTDKARQLFHRVWTEYGYLLVNELTTRWLISTLQTFLDHGQNEAQRNIGACGYFYSNVMKIYEGERAIEGHEQDETYENASPQTPNKFNGLDRYSVGGTDLLLNTNARALNLAMDDDVAGLVLIELLLRVKASANVFTRMDNTRKKKGISVAGFTDTWAFFEPK